MKKLILATILTMISLNTFGAKTYTMSEVSKHSTKESCWIVIEGKVYDVTSILSFHNKIIQTRCGKDATEGFKTQGWTGGTHSEEAHKLRATKLIGVIKGS